VGAETMAELREAAGTVTGGSRSDVGRMKFSGDGDWRDRRRWQAAEGQWGRWLVGAGTLAGGRRGTRTMAGGEAGAETVARSREPAGTMAEGKEVAGTRVGVIGDDGWWDRRPGKLQGASGDDGWWGGRSGDDGKL
jgi:hypothetical protein